MNNYGNKKSYLPVYVVTIVVCIAVTAMIWVRLDGVLLSEKDTASSYQGFTDKLARTKVLVDPGHGGEDGGTSSGEIIEKDINLQISLKLADLLRIMGYDVSMTRDGDYSIYDEGCKTLREKKVSDLNNRLKMYNENDFNISVHQNFISNKKYHGTQVFYNADSELGAIFSANIRQSVIDFLQPENRRALVTITDNIFLMYKAQKPAVLVECWFMSNPDDLYEMQQDDSQKKMAFAIACGALKTMG